MYSISARGLRVGRRDKRSSPRSRHLRGCPQVQMLRVDSEVFHRCRLQHVEVCNGIKVYKWQRSMPATTNAEETRNSRTWATCNNQSKWLDVDATGLANMVWLCLGDSSLLFATFQLRFCLFFFSRQGGQGVAPASCFSCVGPPC